VASTDNCDNDEETAEKVLNKTKPSSGSSQGSPTSE